MTDFIWLLYNVVYLTYEILLQKKIIAHKVETPMTDNDPITDK